MSNNAGGAGGAAGGRKQFARGQATRGANSGPAVMLMPPHIRSTFMPNPPLPHLPSLNASLKRKHAITGVSQYLSNCTVTAVEEYKKEKQRSTTADPAVPVVTKKTPLELKLERQQQKSQHHTSNILEPQILLYRKMQKDCGGEYNGMNCYNTLFIGRLAYEVTERKLLREMESFGLVKDIKIIKQRNNNSSSDSSQQQGQPKSRGYAFVEYEQEDDMKRAYRAADGMRIEGREIVVDVERGHTVPTWLPRRLGGGLGGTRLGGKEINVTRPGRFDPKQQQSAMRPENVGAAPGGMMIHQHPQQSYHQPPSAPLYPPPPPMGRGGGGPPPMYGGAPPPPTPLPSYVGGGGGDRYGGGGDRYGGGSGGDRYGGGPLPPPPPRDWGAGRGGGDRHGGAGGGGDWEQRKRRRSPSPDHHRGGRHHGGGGGGGRDSSSRRR